MNPHIEQARRDLTLLTRTEQRVRVGFTMLVDGVPRAVTLDPMIPLHALDALDAALSTAEGHGAEITSVTVTRVDDVAALPRFTKAAVVAALLES